MKKPSVKKRSVFSFFTTIINKIDYFYSYYIDYDKYISLINDNKLLYRRKYGRLRKILQMCITGESILLSKI
ncbi:hypothetical protein E1I18_03455 [Mycoplasmopsis mucosicanis]|uniref:Uncharacterized protein n=1 Tax=Mycoplasmopsis mucosicanis TaxID=458208 RepID=A0A507SMM0_9BACT|nr:hypothetical protein E1I18_03455 [Mycoplasmopsis mucosicanis]